VGLGGPRIGKDRVVPDVADHPPCGLDDAAHGDCQDHDVASRRDGRVNRTLGYDALVHGLADGTAACINPGDERHPAEGLCHGCADESETDDGDLHRASSRAATKASFSPGVPTLTRIYSSRPKLAMDLVMMPFLRSVS